MSPRGRRRGSLAQGPSPRVASDLGTWTLGSLGSGRPGRQGSAPAPSSLEAESPASLRFSDPGEGSNSSPDHFPPPVLRHSGPGPSPAMPHLTQGSMRPSIFRGCEL